MKTKQRPLGGGIMQKLLDGIINFRRKDYETHKELFRDLKTSQHPHTLFITCCDSRIHPNMITGALPGELFIVRNVANIVPPYSKTSEYVSIMSAIEYAVLALNVENIIVCGHSNCGGCAASLKGIGDHSDFVHTKKWLQLIEPVRNKVIDKIPDNEPGARKWMMEQGNVLEQLKNLGTYPYIVKRVNSGRLQLSGWHYIIETGEVYIYKPEEEGFVLSN